MLPQGAGNYAGNPNDAAFRQNLISKVDPAAPTGVTPVKQLFEGPTAKAFTLDKPCFEQL